MAVVTFRRPPRLSPPPLPIDDIQFQPPPSQTRPTERPSPWLILPVLIAALAAVTLLISTQGGSPLQLTAALLFAASSTALAGWCLWAQLSTRSRRMTARRIDYQRHLADIRQQARAAAAAAQQAAQLWAHPDPRALMSLIRTSRLWERRPTGPDFAAVRIGLGDHPLAAALQPAAPLPSSVRVDDGVPPDAVAAAALRRLLRVHRTVPDLPMVLPLRSVARVRLEGDVTACRQLAAAMVLQAVCWHAPSDCRIALCIDDDGLADWDWLKWIPHLADPAVPPTDLPRFAVARDLGGIEDLLRDELTDRPWAATDDNSTGSDVGHILVVLDGGGPGGRRLADTDGVRGVTVLDVRGVLDVPTTPRLLRLRVTVDDVLAVTGDAAGGETSGTLGHPISSDRPKRPPPPVASPPPGSSPTAMTTRCGLPPAWPR